jgi:hypothetical protein
MLNLRNWVEMGRSWVSDYFKGNAWQLCSGLFSNWRKPCVHMLWAGQ